MSTYGTTIASTMVLYQNLGTFLHVHVGFFPLLYPSVKNKLDIKGLVFTQVLPSLWKKEKKKAHN